MPIALFLHRHLTTLNLFLSPNDLCDENSTSLTQVASKGMAPIASHTVIDRLVWHLDEEEEEDVLNTRLPSSAVSH